MTYQVVHHRWSYAKHEEPEKCETRCQPLAREFSQRATAAKSVAFTEALRNSWRDNAKRQWLMTERASAVEAIGQPLHRLSIVNTRNKAAIKTICAGDCEAAQ